MLDYTNLTLYEQVTQIQQALAATVTPSTNGPIQSVFPYEPRLFGDNDFTALTIQHTGFANTADGIAEILLPNVLYYTVRAYYPVLDSGPASLDGLQTAQDKTLAAMSAFYEALLLDATLADKARFAGPSAGRIVGLTESGNLLYGYETDVEVRAH